MGFYDAKGYWRNDGEGFYDFKGYWVNPGGAFYDSRGYLRKPGEGFYDAKGRWVSPGGAYYDGKGYIRTGGGVISSQNEDTDGGMFAIGFILLIPMIILSSIITAVIEWTIAHFYIVFIGYSIISVMICLFTTKIKKHKGMNYMLSFIGNYMCMMSFIYVVLLYAVPYVINGSGLFDFILVLSFSLGGMVIIQYFNYYHEKPILELLTGILCFIVVIIFLKNNIGSKYSIDSFAQIYGLKSTTIFKLLFGIIF